MKMKQTLITLLFFCVLTGGTTQAGVFEWGELSQAYSYLNQLRVRAGMTVATEFIDGNTLRINLTGSIGQKATFNLSGGRHFAVRISPTATGGCEQIRHGTCVLQP